MRGNRRIEFRHRSSDDCDQLDLVIVCYTRRMKMIMKETNNITEAQLLLNNEVKVTTGLYRGQIGFVEKVMADGRSLQIVLANRFKAEERVFLDVTFVSEIQEPYNWPKGEPNLGPDANSVLPHNRL